LGADWVGVAGSSAGPQLIADPLGRANVIELWIIYRRARVAALLAKQRGLSGAFWAFRTVLTWIGVELLACIVIGTPIMVAAQLWGGLTDEESEIGFVVLAYLPAILLADRACRRLHQRLRGMSPSTLV
jgi:hypothetical protein